MSNGKPSRWWPYIKNLARLVSVPADVALPGTGVGIRFLTDLQDDLAKNGEETKGGIKEALQEIRANPAEIVKLLAAENLTVTDEQLHTAAKDVAEALYLWQIANDYVYADFKGIEQQERVASLKLDDIFVDLKAVTERSTGKRRDIPIVEVNESSSNYMQRYLEVRKFRGGPFLSGRSAPGKTTLFNRIVGHVGENDEPEIEALKDTRATPQPIDHILSRPGGVVLMGGPGSGKTTLVKRLARSCALGAEELKQRYPLLPWCFPVVLPISTFQTERGERDVYRFIRDRLTKLGGEILGEVFVERWAAGQCLVLLDGLDEVAEMASRTRAARAVDELLLSSAGNRVVVTTRVVGYNITRLSVPAEHHILEPFSPQEIATFVRQWYLAHDRALHPDHPDPAQAAKDAQSLIDDVQKNPGVATLATNPLMLTIIALIKHANVVLPERRVELYEIALNTLLRSWNRARSLSTQVPAGEEPKLEKTKKLWAAVAYWMHCNVSRTITENQLSGQLHRVLMEEFHTPKDQADDIASSYLAAAKDRSGLLEARGPSTFAFVHQTFQEYLAAIHLAIPGRNAVVKIQPHVQDPRWHEAIRLAAGYIVIHQSDFDTLGELMRMLLDDDDPLEPYLATSLRLAMACLSDEIGIQTEESDRLLVKVFDHLTGKCYRPLQEAFLKALSTLRVVPGESVIGTLCQAAGSDDARILRETARLLARLPVPAGEALRTLHQLFEMEKHSETNALAAWGLWQSNQRRDCAVALAIAHGMPSRDANMKLGPQPTLLPALVKWLKGASSYVRFRLASVLGSCGHQAQAVPVLVGLLKDADGGVRSGAAEVLGGWDPQTQAVPALVELLKDENHSIRSLAVEVLGGWGHQAQAVPVLIELLKDADRDVRFRGAEVLGSWGHQAQAVPVLVELLRASSYFRFRSAEVLGGWGHQAQAVPVLVELLKDADFGVRYSAAEVLGGWGHQVQAVPVMIEWLKDAEVGVRFSAARMLGDWGHQVQVMPVLVERLKNAGGVFWSSAVEALGRWGKNEEVVRGVVLKLFRAKGDAEFVVQFLLTAANGGAKQRSDKINHLLVKGLKPNGRDSDERRALRQILFRWTWDALATTA